MIEVDDSLLSIGEEVEAHGDHNVPSTWVQTASGGDIEERSELGEKIVYDAASTATSIVYATQEGISIATDERIDVVESRAIRLVAG